MRRYLSWSILVVFLAFGTLYGCNDSDNDGGTGSTDPIPSDTLQSVLIEQADVPTSCDDSIWANSGAQEIAVATSTVSAGSVYGDGQLNMSGTFAGLSDFNGGADPNLTLTALYTTGSGQLFIRAQWDDAVFNLDRRRALYNGPADPLKADDAMGFTSQLNDDKIGFAYEIESASSTFGSFDEVGCAASCHFVDEELDMRPGEGKVDIWHWKTSRSEPMGYVNDQFSEPVDGRKTDAGTSIEARNRKTDNRSGPELIWDGTVQTIPSGPRAGAVLDPAFILLDSHLTDVTGRDPDNGETIYQASCAGCHGVSGEGGLGPAFDTLAFGSFSDAEIDAKSADGAHPGMGAYAALSGSDMADVRLRIMGIWGIPGYYLMMPAGSAADLTTISNIDYSPAGIDSLLSITTPQGAAELNKYKFLQDGYCVIIVRDLETGNDDDVQFDDLTEEYVFGVALMDNDGKNHVGNTRLTQTFLP